jgi:5-methylcytosine-specific restriction endonuclease McrA
MTGGVDLRTLLLTQGFEPLSLLTWKRAFTLLARGKVEVLEEYQHDVRTHHARLAVPAVVRLVRAVRWFRRVARFSRANVYARDGYRCQYCGELRPGRELTYDHVVPRAQGGVTSWTNVVTCCIPCNARKGNRTPAQAGMPLLKPPVRPHLDTGVTTLPRQLTAAPDGQEASSGVPEMWRAYLSSGCPQGT